MTITEWLAHQRSLLDQFAAHCASGSEPDLEPDDDLDHTEWQELFEAFCETRDEG